MDFWSILAFILILVVAWILFKIIRAIVWKVQDIKLSIDSEKQRKAEERATKLRKQAMTKANALLPTLNMQLYEECIKSQVTKDIVNQIKKECQGLPYEITVGNNYVQAKGTFGNSHYDFLAHGITPINSTNFKCIDEIDPDIRACIARNGVIGVDRYIIIRTVSIFAEAIGGLLSSPNKNLYCLVDSNEELKQYSNGDYYTFYNGYKPVTLNKNPTKSI